MLHINSSTIAFAVLLTALSTTTGMAADASSFDVLGIKLGMTPDVVEQKLKEAIPDIKITRQEGTISLRGYTSDNFLFGFQAKQPPEGNSVQELYFTFDVMNGGRLLNIKRYVSYDEKDAPTIDEFQSSIIKKYGNPVQRHAGDSFFYYAKADASVFKPSFPSFCQIHVADNAGMGAMQLHGNFGDPGTRDIKCGIWMRISFEANMTNDQLLNSFSIGYGDITALGNESLRLIQFMSDQEKKHNSENPNTNKPAL